jgi:hypothetical protein
MLVTNLRTTFLMPNWSGLVVIGFRWNDNLYFALSPYWLFYTVQRCHLNENGLQGLLPHRISTDLQQAYIALMSLPLRSLHGCSVMIAHVLVVGY